MAPPLIQLKNIALTFGGTPLLSDVELSVSAGERVCLIGRNGSGKSTLLKIAAGLVESDSGSRFVQPGATVRYLPQEPDFTGHATTLAYVEAGLGPGDDHYQARYILEQLGLHGDEDPAHVSGGEARRAALARVLAPSSPGETRCWRKKSATSTSSTARSSTKNIGCATAFPAAASATSSGSAISMHCASSGAIIAAPPEMPTWRPLKPTNPAS